MGRETPSTRSGRVLEWVSGRLMAKVEQNGRADLHFGTASKFLMDERPGEKHCHGPPCSRPSSLLLSFFPSLRCINMVLPISAANSQTRKLLDPNPAVKFLIPHHSACKTPYLAALRLNAVTFKLNSFSQHWQALASIGNSDSSRTP